MNRQLNTDQERISTGLRVNRASDDPTAVTDILRLNTQIASSERMQQDLGRVKAEVDTAENAMQAVVKLMERAITVASQGATSTSADKRPTLALEAKGLLEQLVSLSRTTADGRYVFSGDNDQQPSYALVDGKVQQLTAVTNTRVVPGPGGAELSVTKTAAELFDERDAAGDPAAGNVFTALQKLHTALG
ncbi:MAG: hypothetical protein NTY38_01715, partial [Acidobacteria bacterium]|nr:hypothetical protein [Acidobacteriota bacterium]